MLVVGSLLLSVPTGLADDEQVVRGQIIVHTDTRETHVIPSPVGDPNVYLQLKLFQDFTGDFTGRGTAIFISTVHHDGKFPDGTITFTGREAEFGTMLGRTGAFYFDGGILGFEDFRAVGNFFPSPNPSVNGNLSHTADYSIKVRFKDRGAAAVPVLDVIRLAIR
ncbi:MAG: hypothetical protein JOY61_13585 [Chloroflexi bacterium]|nr:hypothetical protein [Chloroflexota bacterium]